MVLDRISAWIEGGELLPGESIKDGELAARLGVSRTPVREALQVLAQRGLVEMEPGRLTRVTETSIEDVARVYAPLAALQALAAELGTPHATTKDVEQMRRHNAALLKAVEAENAAKARDADRSFHEVLVNLADNAYLNNALEPLMSHTRRFDALFFRDQQPGYESHREHEEIIEAVATNDPEAAARKTRENFHRYWNPDDSETSVASELERPDEAA